VYVTNHLVRKVESPEMFLLKNVWKKKSTCEQRYEDATRVDPYDAVHKENFFLHPTPASEQ